MQNSSGDIASPWYMPHLMLTWAIGFELASRDGTAVYYITVGLPSAEVALWSPAIAD